jgi:hypothetical protein
MSSFTESFIEYVRNPRNWYGIALIIIAFIIIFMGNI